MFTHTVNEAREQVRKSETWTSEIDGYDVYVVRDNDDHYEVSVYPNNWRQRGEVDRMRLPLLRFYPKHVDNLTALADLLPSVLRQLADGMRSVGLVDLRSSLDIMRDNMDAQREQWQAEFGNKP